MVHHQRNSVAASTLLKTLERPRSRYLVYTSAGDHSNIADWVRDKRGFDLWITYYGDRPDGLLDCGDYYNVRRGAKFQNLHHAYEEWPQLLQRYVAVFVLDDDIQIDAPSIDRLFEIRDQFDYWAIQPAFSPRGKIAHPITRVRRSCLRRNTSFVENGCVLFRRDKLDAFMLVYDPVLVGWGIDWWYLDVMGPDLRGRLAIIDEVPCVNPHDRTKGGREIDRLQSTAVRKAHWESIKEKHRISGEARGQEEFERFEKPRLGRLLGFVRGCIEDGPFLVGEIRRRIRRILVRGLNRSATPPPPATPD